MVRTFLLKVISIYFPYKKEARNHIEASFSFDEVFVGSFFATKVGVFVTFVIVIVINIIYCLNQFDLFIMEEDIDAWYAVDRFGNESHNLTFIDVIVATSYPIEGSTMVYKASWKIEQNLWLYTNLSLTR